MKILVTGASGFIGKALCYELFSQGHDLVLVGRSEKKLKDTFFFPFEAIEADLNQTQIDSSKLDRIDAVVHLAGESVAKGRWTHAKKKRIEESRTFTTKNLVDSFNSSPSLKTFISASAVGIYGENGDQVLTEESNFGNDFLSKVCQKWEAIPSEAFKNSSTRSVQVRIGLVVGHGDGMMGQLIPLFRSGLAGALASGNQWMPWIHVDDLVGIFLKALNDSSIQGPVNGCGPNPVTNKEFTKTLAKHTSKPAVVPTPYFALRIGAGEVASHLIQSMKVIPKKALSHGYEFKFKDLKQSFEDLFPNQAKDSLFLQHQFIEKPLEDVYSFFSDAYNLEKITPAFLKFKIDRVSSESIQKGTLIDYSLKIHGIPVSWRTEITHWDPPKAFEDNQIKGPYKKWHHRHEFKSIRNGVWMTDRVWYREPMGFIGHLVSHSFVKKDVEKIFNHRSQVIKDLFSNHS